MEHTIESGASVSHYRIISAIGAGGMGQVYKAQDVTLDRTVALKILPAALVRNDERVRRFVQEAKSASSLNHPNIITIHEIGQSSVASAGGGSSSPDEPPIHYIAMELIDGATLKGKIHDSAIDLRTLLGYLGQAAEGLAKAHAAGIIHRDLKPENIMVTRDGFAKVLDFGLAKLSVKKTPGDGSTATERRGTREGTILGTVGYMSPEQVRGEIVDQRSDIFSFGCILYEATTRQRPFEADSDIDVMHKIMHEKPAAVDELNPQAPAELRRMIRRCLAKDPERRYQSMKDLAIELADVVAEFDELSASTASRSSGSLSQPLTAAGHRRVLPLVLAGIIALLALAAIGIYAWRTRTTSAKNVPIAYGSMKVGQLTTSNNAARAAISPDGKYVALVNVDRGQYSLSVLQVATKATVQIVPPVRTPFTGIAFSPDSNYLFYNGYEAASGIGYASLFQVPSLGGTPRRVLFDIDTAVTFSPDGRQIAFGRGHPDTGENWVVVANADGSGERKLMSYKRFSGPKAPSWSPDGKTIVTSIMQVAGGVREEITAVDVVTGVHRVVGKRRWAAVSGTAWLPDGAALVVAANGDLISRSQIWLQPYPDGEPVRITNDLNHYNGVTLTSDGSTIATIRGDRDIDLVSMTPGQAAPTLLVPHSSYDYDTLSVARNGMVVASATHENGFDVAVIDPGADRPRLLTHDGKSAAPVVSADGSRIIFDSFRVSDVPHIFIADSDGGGVRQLTNGSGEVGASISADGSVVTYTDADGNIFRLNVAGGPAVLIAKASFGPRSLAAPISSDGKKFFCVGWRTAGGRSQALLRIADIASGKVLVEIPWQTAGEARWSPSGDGLLFVRRSGGVANLYTVSGPGAEPKPLTNFTEGNIFGFDSTPDGKLILARGKTRNDVVTIRDFR